MIDLSLEGFDNTSKIISDNRMIHMWCEKKNVIVSAPLTQDLSTSITNQWTDYFQGGLIGGAINLLDQISSFKTAWTGISLHQPFMSRKMWNGTSPLSFQLDFNFVATTDAKTEVVDNIKKIAIMATASKGEVGDDNLSHLDTFLANADDTEKTMFSNVANVVVDLTSLVTQQWVIPGPNVIPSKDEKRKDSPITIDIPMFGTIKDCYIENVSITTSKSLDINGNPLGAKVSVKVTRMDSIFNENKDGTYELDWGVEYTNNTMSKISTIVDTVLEIGENFFMGTYARLFEFMSGGIPDQSEITKIIKRLRKSNDEITTQGD